MKIRAFTSFSESGLEKKVNSFIASPDINVLSIQFQAVFYLVAMITYEDKKSQDIREEKA